MSNQPWQKERAASLHDEPAARKDESDLGLRGRDSDVHGECHRDAYAYCAAVQGADGRLAAAVNGESDAAAALLVLGYALPLSLS